MTLLHRVCSTELMQGGHPVAEVRGPKRWRKPYSGLVAVGSTFELVFVKSTTDPCNRTDVFAATVE
jgi:hypothetical protein